MCTYNDETVSKANSDDMRKFINNVKQFTRNKINKYKKVLDKSSISRDKIEYFKELLDSYQWKLENLMYIWKVEFESSGKRDYNPHFHVLMYVPFFLKLKRLQSYWKCGSLHLDSIKNPKKASIYISKYFSKETKEFEQWAGKHWSHSRNMKTVRGLCRYIGQMTYEYAKKFVRLTEFWELNHYEIQKLIFAWRKYRSAGFILDVWHMWLEAQSVRFGVS